MDCGFSLPFGISLQALEIDFRIRCRNIMHSDENLSLKISNLGVLSQNCFFDFKLRSLFQLKINILHLIM